MVVGVALAFFVLQHADTFRVPKGFFVLAWKASRNRSYSLAHISSPTQLWIWGTTFDGSYPAPPGMFPTYAKAANDAIKLPRYVTVTQVFLNPSRQIILVFQTISSHLSLLKAAFPHCSTNVTCIFGGDPMKDRLEPQPLDLCKISAKIWRNQRCWKGSFWIRGGKALLNEVSLCFPIVLTPTHVMIGDCITQVNVCFSLKDHHVVFLVSTLI